MSSDYDLERDDDKEHEESGGIVDGSAEYRKAVYAIPRLSDEQLAHLLEQVERGNPEAIRQVVEANLRLALSVASKFRDYIGFDDAVGVANEALMLAVKKFDEGKGERPEAGSIGKLFSTFIVTSIKNALNRYQAVNNYGGMKVPERWLTKLGAYRKAQEVLINKFGREPTVTEILGEAGISYDEYVEISTFTQRPQSLDEPVEGEDGDDLSRHDLIGDSTWDPQVVSEVEAPEDVTLFERAVAALPNPNLRKIAEMVLGLNGSPRLNQREIAKIVGLSLGTVNKAWQTARASLRKTLNETA